MVKNEVLKALKIQTVNTPKIKELIRYVNENNIDISSYDSSILSSKSAFAFICAMNSTKKTAELLFNSNESTLRAINCKPLFIAEFYNIYDLEDTFVPLYDISFLTSKDYLKLVPIEWTKKYIFENTKYYLKKQGKGYSLTLDEAKPFEIDHEYKNVFDENLTALEKAKSDKELINMVKKLSDAKI